MASGSTGLMASAEELAIRLNATLCEEGQQELSPDLAARFGEYGALLLKWNARMNLTAVRDTDGILRRHFVESIRCARAFPEGIETLLDFGSGAGFPGLPIAICRPEIQVTLAESQTKKASFLREAVRTLGLHTQVHSGRAEALGRQFACVALRAVDKMSDAVRAAAGLVAPGGWLALLTTRADLPGLRDLAEGFTWDRDPVAIGGTERVVALGRRG